MTTFGVPHRRTTGPTAVVLVLLLGVACVVAGIVLYRHGIVANPFPSYVDKEPAYAVVRYSAPWIAGGLAIAGLGVLLILAAVAMLGPAIRQSATPRVPPVPRSLRAELE